MAFTRKHLGNGTVASASTETTMYQPAATNITGVLGSVTFFNSSTTAQIVVTVYGPHTGAAADEDIVDEVVINPRKSYICRAMINKVVGGSNLISVECDAGSDVLTYSVDGAEEASGA